MNDADKIHPLYPVYQRYFTGSEALPVTAMKFVMLCGKLVPGLSK